VYQIVYSPIENQDLAKRIEKWVESNFQKGNPFFAREEYHLFSKVLAPDQKIHTMTGMIW
jgi:hypothetical protein